MSIAIQKTKIDGVVFIKPDVHKDDRGFFYESWRLRDYKNLGFNIDFVQDNCSYSKKHVLRGLHIQKSQGQILWVSYGHAYQVVLDIRINSKTFGQYISFELKHEDPIQVYMPPGCAGGFCVISDVVCMNYKCSQYYNSADEGGVLWNDPDLGIQWPVKNPIISDRDRGFNRLKDMDLTKIL